jgi:hypothetical protein
VADQVGANFNATIPIITNTIPAIFTGFNVSPNSKTPIVRVPAAPISGPDGVGDPDLQHLQGSPEQEYECREQRERGDAPTETRVPLGIFHRDGPADIQQTGGNERKPGSGR